MPRGKKHRLLELLVREVSLVDRAANQRRFLVVKREEGSEMEFAEMLKALGLLPEWAEKLDTEQKGQLADALQKAADAFKGDEPEATEPAEGEPETQAKADEPEPKADEGDDKVSKALNEFGGILQQLVTQQGQLNDRLTSVEKGFGLGNSQFLESEGTEPVTGEDEEPVTWEMDINAAPKQ